MVAVCFSLLWFFPSSEYTSVDRVAILTWRQAEVQRAPQAVPSVPPLEISSAIGQRLADEEAAGCAFAGPSQDGVSRGQWLQVGLDILSHSCSLCTPRMAEYTCCSISGSSV